MNSNLEIIYCVRAFPNMSIMEVTHKLIALPLLTPYRTEYYSILGISSEDCTIYLN